MTKEAICSQIQQINDENDIEFYLGDSKIVNRFDRTNNHLYEQADLTTDIAYTLYSYVINAIIYKAQGKSKSSNGYQHFSTYLDRLIQGLAKDIITDVTIEKNKALVMLDAFLFDKENIKIEQLLACLVPLAYIKVMKDNPAEVKKIAKLFQKEKEVIFNLTLKFIRSLYHIKLTIADASLITIDCHDLGNGLFAYKDELILPAWQSAYTLEDYKDCALHLLQRLSDNFPLKDIKAISLLYLSKDFEAKYILK